LPFNIAGQGFLFCLSLYDPAAVKLCLKLFGKRAWSEKFQASFYFLLNAFGNECRV